MTHPTDDELEMRAQLLEGVQKILHQAGIPMPHQGLEKTAAMLRRAWCGILLIESSTLNRLCGNKRQQATAPPRTIFRG